MSDLTQMIPPQAIWGALLAAGLMPILLAGFSRSMFSTLSPGKRFWLALIASFGIWLSITIFGLDDIYSRSVEELAVDMLAGAFIIFTAGLVLYSVWSLACFGFTKTMLTSIAEAKNPQTGEQWASLYGNGHGMQAFTHDRIRVLVAMKLAREHQGSVFLSGRTAVLFSRLVRLSFRVFAIRVGK